MDEFKAKYGGWAVVAGAVAGIGASFSHQLAAKGLNLVLIDLAHTRLDAFAQEIAQQYGVETLPLVLDLSQGNMIEQFRVSTEGLEMGLLVYVACHSVIGTFLETSLEDKLKIVDVNVKGPLQFASELAPAMVKRGRGGIVLMSSLSGFQGTAMVSTYAATKAFDTVLAEGLWFELKQQGIDVLSMVAGATHTPTFDQLTPQKMQASVFPMQPDDVVKTALQQLGRKPTAIAGMMNRMVNFVLRRLLSRKGAVAFISNNTKRVYQ